MAVHASAVGTTLDPRTVALTTRMALAFAAGIGDTGPRTFDDAAESFVAAPTMCVALEWPVLSSPARRLALGLAEDELARAVHVEQDSRFHHPVRPGTRVETTGHIVTVRRTRAGALVRSRLETREVGGAALVTTWHASLFRNVGVVGDDAGGGEAPGRESAVADLSHETRIAIAATASHVYTECSGIWNPIHTERRAARAAGLPDILLHGSATWALAGRELVRLYAGGDPTHLRRLRAWFSAPVLPGTVVTLRHGRALDGRVAFTVVNPDGRAAIADGIAEFGATRVAP